MSEDKLAATREEKIEAIIKDRADWLVDAIATATQNRAFLRGEPEEDETATGAILMNGEKAIRMAIQKVLKL